MRYIWDNDMHIHSRLSLCSKDPEQTTDRILQYAKDNGLKTIVLTDHCWDDKSIPSSDWYKYQDLEYCKRSLPLPKADGIEFLFGVESEMHHTHLIPLSLEEMEKLDFIVVPLTHMHMVGHAITKEEGASPENRAKAWVERFEAFLAKDLPFKKMGLAHLTCGLIAPNREDYLRVLELLPTDKMTELFKKAAEVGVGIELNADDMNFKPEEAETVLKMYRIAKEQGCKFYMGSDAHHPATLDKAKAIFERAIDMLGLTEDDKFHIGK